MQCPKCGYMMDAFEKECQRCLRMPPAPQIIPVPPQPTTISEPVQSSLQGIGQGVSLAVFVAILVFLCWGLWQTSVYEKKINKMMGMSSDQVREVMGNPDRTEKGREDPWRLGSPPIVGFKAPSVRTEYWYYGHWRVCFENDTVMEITETSPSPGGGF